ncbi:MAG TPA: D-glycero-beta-D-manno-heptose 1,7-bisphosphate 7-phosphatase [Phycisphaerales bacterium]|nr:D-glycero-beta-D-manno-heptose 1,7-bisphosphate 7-phosphatase [Phycisphaerales bacterium]
MTHKAVFLDRDDTLISDPGYISDPAQVKLLPHVGQSLSMLKKMGYLLVVVTNQSGIARGIVTEQRLEQIHHHLKKLLADEGVYLDAIYYCPYHPDGTVEQYTLESDLRKPQPGMLLKAAEELEIDLSQSWMIGDSYRDVAAGTRAGCRTILLDTPGKPQVREPDDPEPDKRAVNLREAVNILRMFEFQQKAQAARSMRQQAEAQTTEPEKPEPETPTPQPPSEPKATPTDSTEQSVSPTADEQSETPRPQPMPAETPTTEDKPRTFTQPPETQPGPLPQRPTPDTTQDVKSIHEPKPEIPSSDKTHQLLEEILHRVKIKHRYDQYSEFSVFMLLAWLVQVLAVFSLVVSIWFGLDADRGVDSVQTMIGYAVALQLLVIALLLMHDKSR